MSETVNDGDIEPKRRARAVQNGCAALILALFAVLAWIDREPTDLAGADELEYRALSQSLEQGTYREIFQASAPLAVKYPPAYPAWLVVVRGLAGDHLDAVRFGNIMFAAGALLVLFASVRRLAGGWLALVVLVLAATNPFTLEYAGSMMSEAMYVFLSTCALGASLLAERGRRWAVAAVMVATVLAFLTRTAGVSLIAAVFLWLVLRRPRREAIAFAGIAALVVGAWFAYVTLGAHDGVASYGRDLGDAGVFSSPSVVPGLVDRAASSAVKLASRTVPSTLALPTVNDTRADNIGWLLVLAALIPVGMFAMRRSWVIVPLYVLVYLGLLVAWPYPSGRLFVVIVPAVLALAVFGAVHLWSLMPRPATAATLGLLALLTAYGGVRVAWARHEKLGTCDRSHPHEANACHEGLEHALIHAANYVRAHGEPDDIVVSSKSASFHFLSGHHAVPTRTVRRIPGGAIIDTLRSRGIRYVMTGPHKPHEDGRLIVALTPRCRELKVEWNGLPNGLLLSVLPPGAPPGDACERLDELATIIDGMN